MEKQQTYSADSQQAPIEVVSLDQPAVSHRMLTEAEAHTLWKVLHSFSFPSHLQELRIVLRPEGTTRARGWIIQF